LQASPSAALLAVEALAVPKLVSLHRNNNDQYACGILAGKNVAGAVEYRIDMDDTSDFTSINYTATVTGAASYIPSDPLPMDCTTGG